jgi:hypothetical protein
MQPFMHLAAAVSVTFFQACINWFETLGFIGFEFFKWLLFNSDFQTYNMPEPDVKAQNYRDR